MYNSKSNTNLKLRIGHATHNLRNYNDISTRKINTWMRLFALGDQYTHNKISIDAYKYEKERDIQ